MSVSNNHADAPVTRVEVAVYKIPTDAPEADGTIAWDSTTMVAVHAMRAARSASVTRTRRRRPGD